MTTISGLAYLIIGAIVAGGSIALNLTTHTNSLTLFACIGGLFIIVGIIKLIVNKPTSSPQHHHTQTHSITPHHQTHATPPHHQPAHTTHHTPPENTSSPVTHLPVSPRNRAELAVLSQEAKEAHSFPPIVTCKKCGRRQYRTKPHCFICQTPV